MTVLMMYIIIMYYCRRIVLCTICIIGDEVVTEIETETMLVNWNVLEDVEKMMRKNMKGLPEVSVDKRF